MMTHEKENFDRIEINLSFPLSSVSPVVEPKILQLNGHKHMRPDQYQSSSLKWYFSSMMDLNEIHL